MEQSLLHPDQFEFIAREQSRDQHREDGGLVESKSPHLLIENDLIDTLMGAQLGKTLRINRKGVVVFVKPESLDVVPGEFHEVAKAVRLDLARLKSGDLAKMIAAKRRTACRIDWELPISN